MRVLIVSAVTSWMRGGVPTETRELVSGLASRGHQVALVCDEPLPGAEAACHFPLLIPVTGASVAGLRFALDDFKPDVIHVLAMGVKGLSAILPTLQGRPWALTVHSLPPHELKLGRLHWNERLHYGLRAMRFAPNEFAWRWAFGSGNVPRVIVHSDFVLGCVTRYGFSRDRVATIPLAFRPREAAPRDTLAPIRGNDKVLMCTIGGLAHTKGQHDVVKALPALLLKFPRLRYDMFGEVRDESYLRWLHKLARELGVAEHVQITSDLRNEDKFAVLSSADVYVQPSHEEGFCLAFSEAASVVGRLVGTDSGAIAEMSRGDMGARVVPPKQPASIAQAVESVLDAEFPATLVAARSERLAERFSYAGYLRAHEDLYTVTSHF